MRCRLGHKREHDDKATQKRSDAERDKDARVAQTRPEESNRGRDTKGKNNGPKKANPKGADWRKEETYRGRGERHGNKERQTWGRRLGKEQPSKLCPVLRPDSTDGADFWYIRICMENKGLNGDKPGAKTVLRIAQFGP